MTKQPKRTEDKDERWRRLLHYYRLFRQRPTETATAAYWSARSHMHFLDSHKRA